MPRSFAIECTYLVEDCLLQQPPEYTPNITTKRLAASAVRWYMLEENAVLPNDYLESFEAFGKVFFSLEIP